MPTLAIVGAGPGLGASIARRFGREGYRVAVLSRNPGRLAALAGQLRSAGVDAHPYPADVLEPQTLHDALTRAAGELDGIDMLEYSPAPAPTDQDGPLAAVDAVDLTVAVAARQIEYYLYGGITAVQAVLPSMIERGSGTVVVTTGASSGPVVHPPFANIAAASGALRNWTLNLHSALAPKGVYAAHVAIAAWIGQGGPASQPDTIAESYWQLVHDRSQAELFYVDDTLTI
jgi:NAD(P)-dependent dehydrogenase (short-subunit alcohol dehydrogenase family)